ncbi:alpha/beta hydrolase [Streptomyces sp. NPDC090442]|uniref:alpha/beta hydrolase n=1 Tax=Streptomyces sp. NPDC090442 TaxID=3365962 RepID=UPI003801BAD1
MQRISRKSRNTGTEEGQAESVDRPTAASTFRFLGRAPGARGAGALRRIPRRRGALVLALTALGAAQLVGCSSDPSGVRASPVTAEQADQPSLRTFYQQKLAWSRCGELQCATLTVPMDYAHPSNGKTFALPVIKSAATEPGQRIGSLVFDPGGPGASGVDTLKSDGVASFGKQARAHFDIVGFDPRGVAGSKPAVDCSPRDGTTDGADQADSGSDAARPLYPRTDAERQTALADADHTAAQCQARSGEILPHIGTLDAARDMDVLRAALGDDQLTYLGWSYGTYLGTIYAEQFPRRVRALVLDGALDPSKDWAQQALSSGRAFRKAVDDYADNCAQVVGDACPADTPDGVSTLITDLFAETAHTPLPIKNSTDRLDQTMLHSAITASMYTPDTQWQRLSEALSAAREGDGTKLAAIANQGEGLQDDGSGATDDADDRGDAGASTASDRHDGADARPRDNSGDILTAVNCLDTPHPKDPQAYWDLLERAHQELGVFGSSEVLTELNCRNWPSGPLKPHRVRADDLPPVLVVGTTGDAATPYEDAQSLAAQFPGGMLLTYKGLGHTAYGRGSDCVTNAVDSYLVDLKAVKPETTC